jgi:hypothetical protein
MVIRTPTPPIPLLIIYMERTRWYSLPPRCRSTSSDDTQRCQYHDKLRIEHAEAHISAFQSTLHLLTLPRPLLDALLFRSMDKVRQIGCRDNWEANFEIVLTPCMEHLN